MSSVYRLLLILHIKRCLSSCLLRPAAENGHQNYSSDNDNGSGQGVHGYLFACQQPAKQHGNYRIDEGIGRNQCRIGVFSSQM